MMILYTEPRDIISEVDAYIHHIYLLEHEDMISNYFPLFLDGPQTADYGQKLGNFKKSFQITGP